MLACLLAKKAYDFPFTYINVAGGVDPVRGRCWEYAHEGGARPWVAP